MNQEDIIRMAREAGFDMHNMYATFTCSLMDIERFFKVAYAAGAAAEREACAQVCDDRDMGDCNREDMEARACAAAIRERGQA
jgi:hypothetical protein